MAQPGEAIARYHKLLQEIEYRDLAWARELQDRMRERRLTESGRLLAPVLRPRFVSKRQLATVTRVAEQLSSILDRINALALGTPSLLTRMQMLPAEKMLAAAPSGYARFSVTSRMDAYLRNGSVSLPGVDACKPAGLAYSEILADLFLDLPILKEFKRGKYKISKLGGVKYLRSAILQAWKEFGGRKDPHIAIVEFSQNGSDSSESYLLAERLRDMGSAVEVLSPDELEYANRRLRCGNFEIDIVFRRVLTRELLVHFDLSHPLLAAYRDGNVCVVNNFRSEIAQRRAFFDLLTDEEVTVGLAAADRKLIRSFVPWTRVVAPRKTKYKDQDIDLPEFILRAREQLVLRPNEDGSDQHVFVGAEMSSSAWEGALRLALRNPYVVQEHVSSDLEEFPLFQYGELQMKAVEALIRPIVLNGKMQGASAALHDRSAAGSGPLAIAPVLLIEDIDT